ncbi:hypothetical protein [Mesorhizobium sp. M1163]|uniref:hypothetical protein n=1 Tax=Mesorhizobium sp. M1163 TaxID=2957065 RepID=UPI00333AEA97
MDTSTKKLVKELRGAGLSDQAIKAAWPSWWSDDAASTDSGRAELRFALARKLGLSPRSLLGERVEFIWKDDAKFKNLTAENATQQAALASFGVAIGRLMLRAAPEVRPIVGVGAMDLRAAILGGRPVVDLQGLISACWALGVPVIHLRVFPLPAKSMRAMVVEAEGRHAILLGRDASYPAPVAFTLAHEIGHAALGHLSGAKAIVDIGEPMHDDVDPQEREADEYGLTVLTASTRPAITTNTTNYSARSLARAVMEAGPPRHIDPGTLALCVGYIQQNWGVATASLRHIYGGPIEVWREVNRVAERQLRWDQLNDESADYLRTVMMDTDD